LNHLITFWKMFLGMPWWFYVFFVGPLGFFLLLRLVTPLLNSIIGSVEAKEEKKEEVEADISGLIGTVVSVAMATTLLDSVVGTKKEVTMPNQLIQKKGKLPIVGEIKTTSWTEVSLREGFKKASSEVGLKYLARLEDEYKGLEGLLQGSKVDETVLNLERISKLSYNLYQQGLSFLTKALNIIEQLTTSSKDDLLGEKSELEVELGKLVPGSRLHGMVTERLANNEKSLAKIKEFKEKIDEYFCQVGLCRDSIREIRLGIPELLDNKPREELDRIILELKTRVELAQRVQAEYSKQGI